MFDSEALESVEEAPPTSARIEVFAKSRPLELRELSIEVECQGTEEFEVGYSNGRPVAFFTLSRENESIGIAGVFCPTGEDGNPRSKPTRFSPPESRSTKKIKFELTSEDFSSLNNADVVEKAPPNEYIQIELFVWIDGDWRVKRTVLKPRQARSSPQPYQQSYSAHHPLVLDSLYRTRMGGRKE